MSWAVVHELEHAWFQPPACARHPERATESTCARCGTFCCPACLDSGDPSRCEACAQVAHQAERGREAFNVAWKLALAPALVAFASLTRLAHQREVPTVFAVWLVPLGLSLLLAKTGWAGLAWLGTLTTLGLLGAFALAVGYAGELHRLVDLLWLSIAPLVALPGCVRLSRAWGRVSAPG